MAAAARFPTTIRFELGEPLVPLPSESSPALTVWLATVFGRELSKLDTLRR